MTRARREGAKDLRTHSSPGRPLQLLPEQMDLIPEFLLHGAEAYGLRGQVWTCARVASVIEEEFGIRYHKDHVRRLLKALHWTPQMPITRATQRDDAAVEQGCEEVWPELYRQAQKERRTLALTDETGFYLLPGGGADVRPGGPDPVAA